MSRTNKKHTRNIQRHRRNKGPELLSEAADKKLKEKATEIVHALYTATIQRNVTAAEMLVDLAEGAGHAENALHKVCSLAEKWEREPQVAMLDTVPRVGGGPPLRLLTDGVTPTAAAHGTEEILDAEVE